MQQGIERNIQILCQLLLLATTFKSPLFYSETVFESAIECHEKRYIKKEKSIIIEPSTGISGMQN